MRRKSASNEKKERLPLALLIPKVKKVHLARRPRRRILRQLQAKLSRRRSSRLRRRKPRRKDYALKLNRLKLQESGHLKTLSTRTLSSEQWAAKSSTLTSIRLMRVPSTTSGYCPYTLETWTQVKATQSRHSSWR